MLVIRDLQETLMSIYDPDGNLICQTHNMLTVNDILIQIKENALEGYKYEDENVGLVEISKDGRIYANIETIYDKQLKILLGF